MAEDDVEVKFGASLEGLQAGIEEAKEQVEGLSGPISEIASSFKELGEALIAALAIEKIADFAKEMGELGERTERMSKMLGITTEQVGELGYAAALTGTSTENLALMMGRFEAGLGEADKGTSRIAAGLKSLGLSAKELEGLDLGSQLREIAEAVSKVGDGAAKAAALQDLGRGFVNLIPLLDEGREGFDELKDKADEAGVALDALTTARLVEMQHGMVNLKEEIIGATIAGFKPFIDVVNVTVGFMSDLAKAFLDSATHGGAVKQALDAMADAFRVILQLIADAIAAIKIFGATIEYTITVGKAKFDELGDTIIGVVNDLAHLDLGFSKTAAAAHKGAQDAAAAWSDAAATITAALAENAAAQAKIWKGSPLAAQFGYRPGIDPRTGEATGVPAGGSDSSFKPQPAFPIEQAKGGKDTAAKDAAEDAAHWIKIWTDAAGKQEALLDGELKRHEISTAQWLAGTKDALADELQDTIATYQAELQTANLTAQQRKAISDKITEAEAANAAKVTKAEQKAADETKKSWTSVADSISGLINGQVGALLRGTESISQAFKNMAASAVEELAKLGIKLVAEAALAEALSLATGGAVGGGSPGGFLAGLLHFDKGTDFVQKTGPAILHKGEQVVTADQNPNNPANTLNSVAASNSFRMGNVNIHAQPGQSGADLGRDFINTIQRKGVFAGNSARRYVGV